MGLAVSFVGCEAKILRAQLYWWVYEYVVRVAADQCTNSVRYVNKYMFSCVQLQEQVFLTSIATRTIRSSSCTFQTFVEKANEIPAFESFPRLSWNQL